MRRWLRVVGAAAVALVPLLAGSPTSVAAAQRLTLVSEQFNVTVGDSLTLVVQVPADIDLTTLGDFTVTVTAYHAVATREAVAQAIKGSLPRSVDSVDVPSAGVVRPSVGQLQVSIPIEATTRTPAALQLAQPGLYPLTVELQSRGVLVADLATFVHRVPSATEPPDEALPVAMVMATSSAVTLSGAGRVVLSTADIAQLTHLADVLEASAVPVAVRIPAALLAALPDSGAEGEALAVRLTAELQHDEVLSTPSLPLDPSSAAAAGQQALYTQWLRDGEDSLATSTSANPVRTAVVVDSPLSQGGGALLRDLGARLLVLPVDLYYGLPNTLGGFTDTTQLVQIQVSPGVTVDATVVDRAASNNLALTSTTPTLSAIYAVSDLLAARQQIDDNGGDARRHSITLATPDLSVPAESTVKAFTDLLADTPGLRATTLDELSVRTDQLLNDGRPVVVDLPATAGGDIKDRTDLANTLGLEAASTSSMLPTDDERIAEWTRLVGVVPSSALTEEQAVVIAADLRAQYLAVRSSVKVPAGFSFNLTGRTTTVPVTLRNDADITLTVTVRMSSSKLLFPDGDQTVTLPPQSYFEVRIPIEARSNGRFPVSLAVFTPLGGVPIAPPVPLTASVNAFSGLGNLVTGAALLIVLSWWLRHFRRNRRPRAAADTAQRHPVGRSDAAPHEPVQHGGESVTRRSNEYPAPFVSTNRVRIVTDSACDLPQQVADELGIEIVPLTIRIDGHEYVDRADLTPAEFWAKCSASSSLPETAAPAPGQFEAVYRRLADDGATSIVAINLSGGLSATMQSAELATRSVADTVHVTVVDSEQCTLGLGLVVSQAARLAANGATHDEVVAEARSLAARTKVWGALDTLENLKKGGRIGGARALLASALAIKPIIEVRDGKVEQGGKQRTRSKALAFLVEKLVAAGPIDHLMVLHADCPDVDAFVDMLRPHYPGEIVVGDIGPVVGTHAGRGTIGIAFSVLA